MLSPKVCFALPAIVSGIAGIAITGGHRHTSAAPVCLAAFSFIATQKTRPACRVHRGREFHANLKWYDHYIIRNCDDTNNLKSAFGRRPMGLLLRFEGTWWDYRVARAKHARNNSRPSGAADLGVAAQRHATPTPSLASISVPPRRLLRRQMP